MKTGCRKAGLEKLKTVVIFVIDSKSFIRNLLMYCFAQITIVNCREPGVSLVRILKLLVVKKALATRSTHSSTAAGKSSVRLV